MKRKKTNKAPQSDSPLQLTLFDLVPPSNDDLDDFPEGTITKDMIFLSDVPLTSDKDLTMIPVKTSDVSGKDIVEMRLGRILHRTVPHPTWVQINGNKVSREDYKKSGGKDAKPIMVPCKVTLAFNHGRVKSSHLDVFFAIMAVAYQAYKQEGILSTEIRTTRIQIANVMGMEYSGTFNDMLEQAIHTLGGFTVHKEYEETRLEDGTIIPGHDEKIGQLIVNHSYDTISVNSAGSARGSYPLTVSLNSQVIKSFGNAQPERAFALIDLNYTQNIKFARSWKRQLHRLLNARLGRAPLRIPLAELWVDCLGGSIRDLQAVNGNTNRARQVRSQLRGHFKHLLSQGYITNLDFPTRVKGGDAATEWIYCSKGPNFYADRQHVNQSHFATDLLLALDFTPEQAKQLIAKDSAEHVIDVAYTRMSGFINSIGDVNNRLRAKDWLASTYPRPDVYAFLYQAIDEHFYVESKRKTGTPQRNAERPHADYRDSIIQRVIANKTFDTIDLPPFDHDSPQTIKLKELYAIIFTRVQSILGISPQIHDELDRTVDDMLAADYQKVKQPTMEIFLKRVFHLIWYEKVHEEMIAIQGDKDSPTHLTVKDLQRMAFTTWPEAFAMARRAQEPARSEVEKTVGDRMLKRLTEYALERYLLDERANALKQRSV